MKTPNKNGHYKVMYVKQKSGTFTPRLTLVDSMLRDLHITPNEPNVTVTRVGDGILIKKREEL